MTAWLRRQFRDWPPAATAVATALLFVSPVAGFLYGDATRPPPLTLDSRYEAPATTTTRPVEQRRTTTTTRSQPDHSPLSEEEPMPASDSPEPDLERPAAVVADEPHTEAPTTTEQQQGTTTSTTEPAPPPTVDNPPPEGCPPGSVWTPNGCGPTTPPTLP